MGQKLKEWFGRAMVLLYRSIIYEIKKENRQMASDIQNKFDAAVAAIQESVQQASDRVSKSLGTMQTTVDSLNAKVSGDADAVALVADVQAQLTALGSIKTALDSIAAPTPAPAAGSTTDSTTGTAPASGDTSTTGATAPAASSSSVAANEGSDPGDEHQPAPTSSTGATSSLSSSTSSTSGSSTSDNNTQVTSAPATNSVAG